MDCPLCFEKESFHPDDFSSTAAQDMSNDNQRNPEFLSADYREDTHLQRLPDDISFGAASKAPLLLKSALRLDTSRKPGVAKIRKKRVHFAVDGHKSTATRTSAPLCKRLKLLALDLDRLDGLTDPIFRSTNKQKTRRTRRLKSYIRFGIKDVAKLNALQEQVCSEDTRADQAILKCLRSFKKDTSHEVTCAMFTHPSQKDLPQKLLTCQWQPKQAEYLPSMKMEEKLAFLPLHAHSESHCYQCCTPMCGNEVLGHLSDAFDTLTIHRFD